jgi:hypothetical protein
MHTHVKLHIGSVYLNTSSVVHVSVAIAVLNFQCMRIRGGSKWVSVTKNNNYIHAQNMTYIRYCCKYTLHKTTPEFNNFCSIRGALTGL